MAYRLEIIYNQDQKVEDFLTEHGSIFHSYSFLSSVGENYHVIKVLEENSGEIIGVLPLVISRKFKQKGYHIPPYGYRFGPVVSPSDRHGYEHVLDLLLKSIPQQGHIDLILPLDRQDIIPFKKRNFNISLGQTHIFDVNGENDILKKIHHSKRRYIKKLLKKLETKDLSLVEGRNCHDDLIELQIETAKRNGFLPHIESLQKIFTYLKEEQYYSLVIYDEKMTPLAGAFCPYDKRFAYHVINASAKHKDPLLDKVNFLSTYLAIKIAVDKGLQFDFEGSSIPPVANFYRLMGGKPTVNCRIQKTRSIYYQLLRFLKAINKERK